MIARHAFRIRGTVQGVGFRPFVYTLATELGLGGFVGNDADGVFIEAQGEVDDLRVFAERLVSAAPRLAVIDSVAVEEISPQSMPVPGFAVVPSPPSSGLASTVIPPDAAVCAECLTEMRDPADRRFGYPFIACTQCGPRYTMTTGLPYDRAQTTMAAYALCDPCRLEYEDPASRRFHAQPTACPQCGPSLSMPIEHLVAALQSGKIVAIKGIGGYHLCCDANDASAVDRLRSRKRRGDKPFAVMVTDLDEARALTRVTDLEARLLTSVARPIVVLDLPPSALGRAIGDVVAPRTGSIGVLLPYTPLHHLMFDHGAPRVLVMTSGNVSDEPICCDPAQAEEDLAGIADEFCHHDRRIHVSCDDSVVRVVTRDVQPVRLGRGFTPRSISLGSSAAPCLAVGGELKSAPGIAAGQRAWLGQHVGDMGSVRTLEMLERTTTTLMELQQIVPEVVLSDAHPGYLSRRWASDFAHLRGAEHRTVQHHHAHVSALLAEHGRSGSAAEPMLGIVFDGTGWGADGTIWGGELLVGTCAGVRRVGSLRPISLPGGDAAIRHPARTALAHLAAAGVTSDGTASSRAMPSADLRVVTRMLATGSRCTPTTSVGRLFDAVSSILDVCHRADYEGQAAVELEAHAKDVELAGTRWPVRVDDIDGFQVIDPRGWVARAVADHHDGIPASISARAFHLALAEAVTTAALRICRAEGLRSVGLTGGVFANRILVEQSSARLTAAGLTVFTHRVVPPNDGGLALGQIAAFAAGGSVQG